MGGQYRKMKNMSELFKRGKFCKKKKTQLSFSSIWGIRLKIYFKKIKFRFKNLFICNF